MRDFSPAQVQKRNYIFNTIRSVFEKYGYQPIETPTMENLATLTGKYGEEGDKLLFKVLNSGDYLSKADEEALQNKDSRKLTSSISEKGLRYDLTIPFARYVVQYQNDITFPFKRYQIQPVWRADRPQKGRYREFYQCDADVVGSDSLLNEVELILIYQEVFDKLGIDVTIKVNNRKLLQDLFDGESESNLIKLVIELDKIDKIGEEKTIQNLRKIATNDMSAKRIEILADRLKGGEIPKDIRLFISEDNESIGSWTKVFSQGIERLDGLNELSKLASYLVQSGVDTSNIEADPFLARGLDYYTGTIFEVKANGVDMGSIGGGGRYDNLTGMFGLEGVSGVGISFGAERIYDVMEEMDLFPESTFTGTQALFINFGGEAEMKAFEYLQQFRANDIKAELFPSDDKFKKQMRYADNNNIPYVIFIGEEELRSGQLNMKDMQSGEQKAYGMEEVITLLKQL